jgi:hypothetical protein
MLTNPQSDLYAELSPEDDGKIERAEDEESSRICPNPRTKIQKLPISLIRRTHLAHRCNCQH